MTDNTHLLLPVNAIVQLDPEKVGNKAFAGCLMVVTEPKPWGAQGYVQALGETREEVGGAAYYRAKWEEMSEPLGFVKWTLVSPEPEEA